MTTSNNFTCADLLKIKRATFIQSVRAFQELPSTNDYARAWLSDPDVVTPSLVIADTQTAGRGQRDNAWHAGEGALLFSVLLGRARSMNSSKKKDGHNVSALPEEKWPLLSLHTALALLDAFSIFVPEKYVALKWPNDLLLEWKKCAGILIEPVKPHGVIIGIGINVYNNIAALPTEISASALQQYMKNNPPLVLILEKILTQLDHHLSLLEDDHFDLSPQWNAHCLLKGKTIELDQCGVKRKGLCKGIARDGSLLLEENGCIIPYYSGRVVTPVHR